MHCRYPFTQGDKLDAYVSFSIVDLSFTNFFGEREGGEEGEHN
jgi:hypothetical protein